jgi:alpha-galactosidase
MFSRRFIADFAFLVLLLAACRASAETPAPIRFLEQSKIFVLDAGNATYVFGVNEQNMLQHIYWGGHVERDADFLAARSFHEWASFDLGTATTPQEYPGWGAGLYVEPSLKVTFPDGNRDLVLRYVEHQMESNTLTVTLKDIERELFVRLRYTVYPKTGIIRREAAIENRTGKRWWLRMHGRECSTSAGRRLPAALSKRPLGGRMAAQ